jgi:hypothetical protein
MAFHSVTNDTVHNRAWVEAWVEPTDFIPDEPKLKYGLIERLTDWLKAI